MAVVRFFKMAADRHLIFLQSEILSADAVQRSNMRHRATYRADWSNCYGDMAVFDLRWRRQPLGIFQ